MEKLNDGGDAPTEHDAPDGRRSPPQPQPHGCSQPGVTVLVAAVAMVAEGLAALLREAPELEVTAVTTADDLAERAVAQPPDVIVLDPDVAPDRADIVASLLDWCPRTRILLLVEGLDATRGHELLRQGAHGYLPSTSDGVVARHAVTAVADGAAIVDDRMLAAVTTWFAEVFDERFAELDEQQLELWRAVARDETPTAMAAAAQVSERTVRRRISQLFDRLGVASRVQAAELAGRLRLIDGYRPGLRPPVGDSR